MHGMGPDFFAQLCDERGRPAPVQGFSEMLAQWSRSASPPDDDGYGRGLALAVIGGIACWIGLLAVVLP